MNKEIHAFLLTAVNSIMDQKTKTKDTRNNTVEVIACWLSCGDCIISYENISTAYYLPVKAIFAPVTDNFF